MRKLLICLVFILAGCGGNTSGQLEVSLPATPPGQHVPEISNLKLSPDRALYMEGDGSIQVTAEFAFSDLGKDIQTLHVRMSDGTALSIPVSQSANSVSGTLSETLDVTTAQGHGCTIEVWLVDKAGQSSNHLFAGLLIIRHAPEISNVALSPDSASHMQGDGSVVVTAEITFMDAGRDLQALWIRLPDGTTANFNESLDTETGTLVEDFVLSTAAAGVFDVEFWLVDETGDSSTHRTAEFIVSWDLQSSNWTSRLSGLPGPLYDVVWDGQVFIAVGYGGAIWTSADGIDWVARDSGTDAYLYAIEAHGDDIFAVGVFIVLLSTDHGETWRVKARPDYIALTAVAANSSQVVAIGGVPDLLFPKIMISEDRGDSWQTGDFFGWATDLIYRDGHFVATAGSGVVVSSDGKLWNEVALYESNTWSLLNTVVHDGRQFIVAGDDGTVFSSLDAYNWTKLLTPFNDVTYHSAAWDGSRLVLAGGVSYQYWQDGIHIPTGISSTDGGASWEIFDIDSDYQSNGLASGNGRLVSVGWTLDSDGGAIYTSE